MGNHQSEVSDIDHDIEKVYVCALCEVTFDEKGMYSHECFEAFNTLKIDANLYVYPQCADGTIIGKSNVNGQEVIVQDEITGVQGNDTSQDISNSQRNGTWEEDLIPLVQERRPLWDIRLPIEMRSMQNKNLLWEEIEQILGNGQTVASLKKKWKNLMDSFNRAHKSYKAGASGSAARKKTQKWSHYESMLFTLDVNLEEQTTDSNIQQQQQQQKQQQQQQKQHQQQQQKQHQQQQRLRFDSTGSQSICSGFMGDETLDGFDDPVTETPARTVARTSKNNKDLAGFKEAIANSTPTCNFNFPELPKLDFQRTTDSAFGVYIECSLNE